MTDKPDPSNIATALRRFCILSGLGRAILIAALLFIVGRRLDTLFFALGIALGLDRFGIPIVNVREEMRRFTMGLRFFYRLLGRATVHGVNKWNARQHQQRRLTTNPLLGLCSLCHASW